jgi:hypothetical protein
LPDDERIGKLKLADNVIENVSDIVIGKIVNPTDMICLARDMSTKHEFVLALRICRKAVAHVGSLDAKQIERNVWLAELDVLQRDVDAKVQAKIKPASEQVERLRSLQLLKKLLALVPSFARKSTREYGSLLQSIAATMVTASIESHQSRQLQPSKRMSRDALSGVVESCFEFLQSPDAQRSLLELCSSRGEYWMVLDIALRTLRTTEQLQSKLRRELVVRTEIDCLLREQTHLLQRYKKEALDDAQQSRLATLLHEQEQLAEVAYFELPSIPAYQQLHLRLIMARVSAVTTWCSELERAIGTPVLDRTAEQEAQLAADLADVQQRMQQVVEHALQSLALPSALMQVAAQLAAFPHFAVQFGFKAHALLRDLEAEHEKRLLPTMELDELLREESELYAQAQHRQMLTPDKLNRIRELRLQHALWELEADDTRYNAEQLAGKIRECAIAMTSTIIQREQALCAAIQRHDVLLATAPPADDVVASAAYQHATTERQQALTQIAALHQLLQQVVAHNSSVLEAPNDLKRLAATLTTPQTDNYPHDELHLRLSVAITEQALRQVDKLNNLRRSRLPILEEESVLQREQQDAQTFRKPFASDKVQRLAVLARQQRLWNQEASHRNASADALDKIRYDVVNALVSKLVKRYNNLELLRQTLESDIWTNTIAINNDNNNNNNNDQPSDSMEVESTTTPSSSSSSSTHSTIVADLVVAKQNLAELNPRMQVVSSLLADALRLSLAHLGNPEHLLGIATLTNTANQDGVIQIAKHVFELLCTLQREAQVRAPVREALDALQSEKDELAAVNKQLKDDEHKRLCDLQHQVFAWQHDYAYTNDDWQKYTDWCKQSVISMLSALLSSKRHAQQLIAQFEAAQYKQLSNYSAATSVTELRALATHSPALAAELARIPKAPLHTAAIEQRDTAHARLQQLLPECLERLENPAHFAAVLALFVRDAENAFVIDIAKYTHAKLVALNTIRQQMATLEKKRYLLRLEKYTLEQARAQLSPDATQLLADTEAALDALPEVRYGLDHKKLERLDDVDGESPPDFSVCYPFALLDTPLCDNAKAMFSAAFNALALLDAAVHEADSLGHARDPKRVAAERAPLLASIAAVEAIYTAAADDADAHVIGLTSLGHLVQLAVASAQQPTAVNLVRCYLHRTLQLRDKQLELAPLSRELAAINAEQVQLRQQRKELTPEQTERQRELHFMFEMRKALPEHHLRTVAQLDQHAYTVYCKLLNMIFAAKAARDDDLDNLVRQPRLARGRSMNAAEIESEQRDAHARTDADLALLVELATRYILDVTNLNQLVQRMNTEKVYDSMFVVANEAQSKLKQKLGLQLVYEALLKRANEMALKLAPGAQPGADLVKLREEIDLLKTQLSYSATQLRNWILQNANILIDAARIQDRADIVEEQAILVFKMTMDIKKFEEVQTLVGPARWPDVRTDLLKYVVDYDTSLPGSPIDCKDQIILLLKEGYVLYRSLDLLISLLISLLIPLLISI